MATADDNKKDMDMATDPETFVLPATEEVVPEKHPLQNKWSLWYLKQDKAKTWADNLKKVISFGTVEDFWAIFNHIKTPSSISSGSDYMLFKEGIEPMWEDVENVKGGRWLLTIDKKDRSNVLDTYWLETLLLLIGEGFDSSSDEIRGTVVQARHRGDKIAIWTGHSDRKDDIMFIGKMYRDRLHTIAGGRRPNLSYQSHTDVSAKSGSQSRSLYNLGGHDNYR